MKSLRPSTHRIDALCEALDHPERRVPAIHITGTNGKTSTARIAAAVIAATGLTVGTYTSPHLQTVRERIALNGEPVSPDVFGDVFDHLKPYLDLVESQLGEPLTYFEVLTAMFYLWAAEHGVDMSVVEVGLGGRWDATNVVDGRVAVITNVSLDHVGLLGTDRETIAREKSGIIKQGATVVTGERTPSVLDEIADEAGKHEAVMSVLGRDFELVDNRVAFGGRYLSVKASGRGYDGLFLPLHGGHQGVNAAVAIEAVTQMLPDASLDTDLVNEGLMSASSPGRLETIRGSEDEATLLIDVAHNPDGASALVKALVEEFTFDKVVFVVGVLGDKDHAGMITELAKVPSQFVFTAPSSGRSIAPDDLQKAGVEVGLSCVAIEDVSSALDVARETASAGDLICVTGSHYVVGEARDALLGPPE